VGRITEKFRFSSIGSAGSGSPFGLHEALIRRFIWTFGRDDAAPLEVPERRATMTRPLPLLVLISFALRLHSSGQELDLRSLGREVGRAPLIMIGHVSRVLESYGEYSGFELVVDSQVKSRDCHIAFANRSRSRAEVLRLYEKCLLEQAGVVVTRLEGNRASVTYIDALPITPLDSENWLADQDAPPEPLPAAAVLESSETVNPTPESEAPAGGGGR